MSAHAYGGAMAGGNMRPMPVSFLRPCLPLLLTGLCTSAAAQACPVDPNAPAGTLLSVLVPERPGLRLDRAQLDALPRTERVSRRTVGAAASAPAVEQQTRYAGWLLRDLALRALGGGAAAERGLRGVVFETVATDNYRAYFSWGELFNNSAAEQVLVITAVDGQALGNDAGPLALRALADLRPGPRHVRNLCALVLRPMTGAMK
jgi:hypothetical protein